MSWITRLQQRLSDRLWAQDDAFARQAGWTVTKTTGRFGFEGRMYHDPRFGQRRIHGESAGPVPETGPGRLQVGGTGDGRHAQAVVAYGPVTSISAPKTRHAPAVATQAVLDAINTGQLHRGQLDGCGFCAAKATRQHRQGGPETGHGAADWELENPSIDNGHTDGPGPGREP